MKKNTKNNNQAIDAQELFLAMNDLEKEKGINKEYLLDSTITQKELIELIERKRDIADVNTLSPLTWAYVGDGVFELFVRTHLTNTTKLKPHMLHMEAIKYVKADAQVKLLHKIEEKLTDEEKDIVRRGRNAENHHVPKNSTIEEYSYSTAFEALIGYLYLTKQDDRLKEILKMCV